MRRGRAAAAGGLVVVALAGCRLDLTGAACNTDDNCPVRQFCAFPLGAKQGTCQAGAGVSAILALTADPALLPAGATTQAVATLTADGGPPVPDGGLVTGLVQWSVDLAGEGVISVSNDAGTKGQVQALAPGQATLRGTMVFADQRLEASASIVVSNAELQRIVAVADRLRYAPGTAGSAAATGFFSDGTHADLTSLVKWSSSAPSVLGVSTASGSWGRLSALVPGFSSLRAGYLNLTGTTSVSVVDATLVALSISPLRPRGLEGSDLQLEATGVFSDGTAQSMTRSVRWEVDDQTIAYFGSPGALILLSRGTTIARATSSTVQASAQLDIVPAAPVQLEISPAWPDPLLVGSTTRLTGWAAHQDGTVAPAPVGWSSTDPALTVSPLGDLLAEAPTPLATVVATAGPLEARATAEATADGGVSWQVWPPEAVVAVGTEGRLAFERAHADGTVQDLTAIAGWRPVDVDAGPDVETGERGGTVRPRQPGARLAVLAVVPGRAGRAWVRAPLGLPTLEIIPAAGAFPASARTRLAAVGHWPDGTVLELTEAVGWSASPDGLVVAGGGTSAGLVLGADAGVSALRARFGGATAQAPLTAEPQAGTLEVWPPGATLAAGTALSLSVTLVSASGESTDVTPDAVWTSSAPTVALATNAPGQAGQLLGRAVGRAVLTARLDGLQALLPVVVTGAKVEQVDVQPPSSVVTWAPSSFRATGQLSDGSRQDLSRWVSWTTSDSGILRIRGTGLDRGMARGIDAGVVEVLARPRGGPAWGIPVTVEGAPPASVAVTLPAGPVAVGTRPRVQAVALGAGGATVDVTGLVEWTSLDPSVATVSSVVRAGWLTTLRGGTTTLRARFSGLSGSASLEVLGDSLVTLSISAPGSLQIGSGAKALATATLSGGGSQALGEEIIWSSDAPAVLGVSNAPGARGRLLALAPGTATLRARTRSGLPALQASAVVMVSTPVVRTPAPGTVRRGAAAR